MPDRVQLVAAEGAFGSEEAGDGMGHDPAAVDALGLLVQFAAGTGTGEPLQGRQRRGGDPADGVEAVLAQGAGGGGADAGERRDRLFVQEAGDGAGLLGHHAGLSGPGAAQGHACEHRPGPEPRSHSRCRTTRAPVPVSVRPVPRHPGRSTVRRPAGPPARGRAAAPRRRA